MPKIFIIGNKNVDKISIAKELVELNDTLSIAEHFTTNRSYENKINENYIHFVKPNDVHLSFKNNALLYITTIDFISEGITYDSFYNDDIFTMNFMDFNNITDKVFTEHDILVVWLDTKKYDSIIERKNDLCECKYISERLENVPYLYFLDEKPEVIVNVITEYLNADDNKKKEILEENS